VRAKRTRLAEGIWQDQYGLSGVVRVGDVYKEQRFPVGTRHDFIQAWRARTRAELLEDRDAQRPATGTLEADAARYLTKIDHRTSHKSDRSHLSAWLPTLGRFLRSQIRTAQVQATIDRWREAGKSARTIRHRVRVLRELYQALDGPHARPPTKGLTLPKVSSPHPVATPWALVAKVAKSLKAGKRHAEGYGGDSDKAHARFLVRATTGQRPSQLMRAKPEDVDLKRRIWFVRAGKGGLQVPLPLNAEMVRAWKAFIKADAWGTFDARSFSKTIRRHGWPANMRPYNLRHTFAIDLILSGADLGDVQAALGHRQIETTRAHYAPVQLARLTKTLRLSRRGKL
jgi:integrase